MRLWHEALIPYLPRQQLLGQHRECCALRGLGWGKKHATVDYVFRHPREWMVVYHIEVMKEMRRRGYSPAPEWYNATYRGKTVGFGGGANNFHWLTALERSETGCIYPEHNTAYLQECLDNLAGKGIHIDVK